MEEWKDIEGYEGIYQVSNLGNVKSLERKVWCGRGRGYYKTIPEKILKTGESGRGYLKVILCKGGKSKSCKVHRLVAETFIPNPQGLPEVNHISEDKTDNSLENLEWVSHEYNLNYGTRNTRAGKKIAEKLSGRKLSEEHKGKIAEKLSKPIYGINKVSGLIVEFSSAKEASRQLGIDNSHIVHCLKGKYKSSGGFYWMYAEGED